MLCLVVGRLMWFERIQGFINGQLKCYKLALFEEFINKALPKQYIDL